jgi:hypothetical protein
VLARATLIAVLAAAPAAAKTPALSQAQVAFDWLTGTFSNAEQVGFWSERKEPGQAPPITELKIFGDPNKDTVTLSYQLMGQDNALMGQDSLSLMHQRDGRLRFALNEVKAADLSPNARRCEGTVTREKEAFSFKPDAGSCTGMTPPAQLTQTKLIFAKGPGGAAAEFRKARGFTCWVFVHKGEPKPGNDENWQTFFKQPIHDQGGWLWVKTDEPTPQHVGLRLRNVIWPTGFNRPSLVLYVHKADDKKRAVSYSWANTDAERIGINLRWMQASCTQNGKEGTKP